MTTPAPERPDPDVEKLADLFMDLRLDGPATDGWTYQQTARHYARIILGRWLAGIRQDPSDPLAIAPVTDAGLREALEIIAAPPTDAPDAIGVTARNIALAALRLAASPQPARAAADAICPACGAAFRDHGHVETDQWAAAVVAALEGASE
jgi:hypothetical protein